MSSNRYGYLSDSEDETSAGVSYDMRVDEHGNAEYIETRPAPDGGYIRTTRRVFTEPRPLESPRQRRHAEFAPEPPRGFRRDRPVPPRAPTRPCQRRRSPPRHRSPPPRRERRGSVYSDYDDPAVYPDGSEYGVRYDEHNRPGQFPAEGFDDDRSDYGVRYDERNRPGRFPAEGFEGDGERGRVIGEVDDDGYFVLEGGDRARDRHDRQRRGGSVYEGRKRYDGPLPGAARNDLSESEEEVVVTGRRPGDNRPGYDVFRRRTRPSRDDGRRDDRRR